jgi:uncharacterized membrane protein YhaH (DUF805 family)
MNKKEVMSIVSLVLLFVISLMLWECYELSQESYGSTLLLSDGAKYVLWWFILLLISVWIGIAMGIRRLSVRGLLIATALAAILSWLVAFSGGI